LNDAILVQVLSVCVGLSMGAAWRAGSLLNDGKEWRAVWRDLLVSVFIGGANAVLTLALADFADLGPLMAMALGVLVGATGLRAVPEVKAVVVDLLKRRLTGGDN
jgi:hypothetical protein